MTNRLLKKSKVRRFDAKARQISRSLVELTKTDRAGDRRAGRWQNLFQQPVKGRQRLAQILIWTIAAFYAYGALVHVMNMLSLTGFDWAMAPLKWQVLDVVYLVLDLTVVIGLIIGARFGILAFFAAALSQIALYTMLRPWVLDVPEEFRRSAEDVQYLNRLVLFHIVTCIIMAWSVLQSRRINHQLKTGDSEAPQRSHCCGPE